MTHKFLGATLRECLDFYSIPEPNSGCFLWLGGTKGDGYGGFRCQRAHRVAWVAQHGPIPKGLSVLHKCDVPMCVNPAHLFLGTHKENMRDMRIKKRARSYRGEAHPQAKLADADVPRIIADSRTHREIAAAFGISETLVSFVKSGRRKAAT